MSNKKAFFIGLFGTFAIILPIYMVFAALSLGTSKLPVENKQNNVPVAHPGAQDAKNVLIICAESEDDGTASYTIVRFDALENKISVGSLLPQTTVLCEGQGIALHKAQQNAGPAQAAACIEETLGIRINNYIKATPENFAEFCRPLGIANLLLANYISEEALTQMKLSVPGIESVALSPQRFGLVLNSGLVPVEQLCSVRSDGYLAFLRAGYETLYEVLPQTFKKNSDLIQTDISATDIFDYERILKFLSRAEPEYRSAAFPGVYLPDRFDLLPEAMQTAEDFFA